MADPSADKASQGVDSGQVAAGDLDQAVGPQGDASDALGPAPQGASQSGAAPARTAPAAAQATSDDPLACLPVYVRSLLRISVPVNVRLASKRQSISEIVNLCPGSIITFAKTCDEMLELKAGGCAIAVGEAVKVGDKFGLRINSIAMPNERFQAVRPSTTTG